MVCCKAEEFKWCKGLRAVYKDEEGKEYCAFHAPKGQKGVAAVEEFNDLVFKKILQAKTSRDACDLSGTIFEGPVVFWHFSKKNPLPVINLRGAAFSGEADFRHAAFSGNAYLWGTAFNGNAHFGQAVFIGNAHFEGAAFNGKADFTDAAFNGEAHFREAAFNGKAEFWQAVLRGRAGFAHATFNAEAHFGEAAFNGKADFTQAAFNREADFGMSTFNGKAGFAHATFNAEAHFGEAAFNGKADFTQAAFSGNADFGRCLVEETIRFEEVGLASVSFLETDVRKFHFVRCTWPHKRGRDVLYDEINADGVKAFEQTEDLYRQLKQKYKEEHNEPEASNWHYGEKEMFRKKRSWRRFNPLSISNLYWASSGYGEKPVRAGIMLLLFVAIITILMNFLGLVPFIDGKPIYGVAAVKGFSGTFDPRKCFLLIYNTMQHALFFKTPLFKPETLTGHFFLTVFTRLVIPLQAALFAFAIRNKFRR